MWALQALQREGHQADLLTAASPQLEPMNETYGTSVDPASVRIRHAPRWWLLGPANDGAAMRGARFSGFCQRLAPEYDLLVSTYNLCDFGRPAIHFVADLSWDPQMYAAHDAAQGRGTRLVHRPTPLRWGYLWTARRLQRRSGRDLFGGEDAIVANSRWTADVIGERYGAQCEVVYPPVPDSFPDVPWDQREHGFVCLGRVSHEKRIERMIKILRGVRSRGHEVHFHILGPIGDDPYGRYIRQLAEREPWVVPEGQCVGERKERLLTSHRFAIHGRDAEPFGIAVGEQVKAGCIPFVPNSGGQTEIVNDPSLCYDDADDAVAKIDAVLSSEQKQSQLRDTLRHGADRFSAERFMDEFLEAVDRFAAKQRVGQPVLAG